mgnify:CR=1 FL=1
MKYFVLKNFNPSEYPEYYPIEVNRMDENYFQISLCRKHFDTDYYKILEKLSKILKENHRSVVDFQVEYFGEKGRDFGALKNDFIINLLETISRNWNLQDVMTDQDIDHFEQLGGLLRFVLNSSGELVVGDIFSLAFFEALLKINESEKLLNVDLISQERILQISSSFLNTYQLDFVQKINEGNSSSDSIVMFEDAILKPSRSRVRNLQRVLMGLGYDHHEWKSFQEKGAKNLYISIVGEFDFFRFLECIKFNNVDEVHCKVILDWLRSLTEYKARRFLRFVTSIPKIPLEKIQVWGNRGKVCFQSCFKNITLTKEIENQVLVNYLEYTIAEDNDEFLKR